MIVAELSSLRRELLGLREKVRCWHVPDQVLQDKAHSLCAGLAVMHIQSYHDRASTAATPSLKPTEGQQRVYDAFLSTKAAVTCCLPTTAKPKQDGILQQLQAGGGGGRK